MNEICIVYDSPHKGNTEKLLLKIKEKYADTVLVKAADCTPEIFSRYDVLGFASGIYYGKRRKKIIFYLHVGRGQGRV